MTAIPLDPPKGRVEVSSYGIVGMAPTIHTSDQLVEIPGALYRSSEES